MANVQQISEKRPPMPNSTKQSTDNRNCANEPSSVEDEKYDAALKIQHLEHELSQKDLVISYAVENLENCASSLYFVKDQLLLISGYLEHSILQIQELTQENKNLTLLSDEWLRRAIKREFELLAVKDELNKVTKERDLAIKTVELLQVEQMLADQENKMGKDKRGLQG